MIKLPIDLTPNYSSEGLNNLRKAVSDLLASHTIPELGVKKHVVAQTLEDLLGGEHETEREVAAWFIGPRGENLDLFSELILLSINDHVFWRRNFHPSDPSPITEAMKREPGYLQAVDTIKTEFYTMLAELKKSAPFFSMRYQGHMNWDQTLPGMIGYVAAMLYNQNNVALEASPVTTIFEVEAARDLCRMLGYRETTPQPWGHLTCGGSTANIEALWAARNLKFYPLSFKAALKDLGTDLGKDLLTLFPVTQPSGTSSSIGSLDTWALLNLSVDEVLNLSNRLLENFDTYGVTSEAFNAALSPYSIQNMGFLDFFQRFLAGTGVGDPVVIVPASKHYSLPKGAAILGIGANNMHTLPLDTYGRMDVAALETAIDDYIDSKHPIISIASIFGTTEEGNVDPLTEMIRLRNDKYRPMNVDFALHADCAWGGYFAALLWDNLDDPEGTPLPPLPLSDYVIEQYQNLKHTDTITVDPHKTGYIPYPAGALCYRNMAMRSLIAFEAPYINSGGATTEEELVLGTYGIEGSKPGAAAAGVYLSHAAIRPTRQGYGKILGRTLYNCKVFHWKLLEYSEKETDFVVVPTPKFEIEPIPSFLQKLSGQTPKSLIADREGALFDMVRQTGSDLNILTYAFNYKVKGVLNQNLDEVNAFNKKIYDRMSIKPDGRDIYNYEIIVSTTDFLKHSYGEVFFNDYKERLLGLASGTGNDDADEAISVLRSVIMDPWITEDINGKPFVDYIVAELFNIVREVVAELQA
ncbi:MAG: pyridoxal-dependent decarboxylase [Calothrix sp. MO_167.B12]|nr:pyridoxal-dependent decarboxylase [Calothrix sp. MO_167.B12]